MARAGRVPAVISAAVVVAVCVSAFGTPLGGRAEALDVGFWTPIATSSAPPGRYAHASVWTGREMLVVGGFGAVGRFSDPRADGARYDPTANLWTAIASAPEVRANHTAVWTGSDMLVFGGGGVGLRYTLATDRWLPLPTQSEPIDRAQHVAVWTGTEMLVWGGSTASGPTSTGGRFNPLTDTWRPTSMDGAPSPRWYPAAAWTGRELLVWGGRNVTDALGDGARYDPATDTWTPISADGAPSPRWSSTAVWTGRELLVWGGLGSADAASSARYDPVSDTWAPITTVDAPSPSVGFEPAVSTAPAVWTGQEMLVWAEAGGLGARYDPGLDRWLPLASDGAPSPRSGPTVLWTGSEMLVWGGATGVPGGCPEVCNDGARFTPPAPAPTPGPVEPHVTPGK